MTINTKHMSNNEIINLSNEELRKLQLIELEMLVEVDRICRKNNINYTLAGGTLLGAIRHKGFIPWDDDIDISLEHKNYEKFFEACKKDLDTSRFFLQDFRNDPNYRWGYAKMRRLNTEYIKKGQEHLKQITGICIDILYVQHTPDSKLQRSIFNAKIFCIRKAMYSEVGKLVEKNIFKRLLFHLLSLIPINVLQEMRLKELNKYNDISSKYMACQMLPIPCLPFGYKSTIFDGYMNAEFEGMKFMIVRNYDEYLTEQYGDYMTLPPIDKRKGVMNAIKYKFIDIKYEDILKEYTNNRNGY